MNKIFFLELMNFFFQILIKIFCHLTVFDRQTAGLVCKDWFEVSKRAVFLKKCIVKIGSREDFGKNDLKNPRTMELFANTSRSFVNFDFRSINLNLIAASNSYKKFGQNIQRLSFYRCNVTSENLEEYLKMSPNVTKIEFEDMSRDVTEGWFCDSTPTLQTAITHLKWHESEAFISETLFTNLTAMCPKLESIELRAGYYWPQYRESMKTSVKTMVRLEVFYLFLKKFSPTLRAIGIDEINWPCPQYVACLIYSKLPFQLDSLKLKRSRVSIHALNEFLKSHQKSLKTLHLEDIMCDSETIKIISMMTNLQDLKLELHHCKSSNVDIKDIKVLSKLKVSISRGQNK
jgi:hypothetical protein